MWGGGKDARKRKLELKIETGTILVMCSAVRGWNGGLWKHRHKSLLFKVDKAGIKRQL